MNIDGNNCEEVKFTRDSRDIIETCYNEVLEDNGKQGITRTPTMHEVLFKVTDALIEKYSKSEKVYEYQLERKSWKTTGNILKCIEIYYERNNLYDMSARAN